MDQLARSGCRIILAVLATEAYQPLLDSARDFGMTARYVWITLDAAKGALASDGLLIFSRQASPSITLKAFQDAWRADTTIYNKATQHHHKAAPLRPERPVLGYRLCRCRRWSAG